MSKEELVQQFPFWNMLNKDEKRMVRQRSIERFYHKEENILCFNDACLGMILVLEGSIRVSLTSAQVTRRRCLLYMQRACSS